MAYSDVRQITQARRIDRRRLQRAVHETPLKVTARLIGDQVRDGDLRMAKSLAWRLARQPARTPQWLAHIDGLARRSGLHGAPIDIARKPGDRFLARGLDASQRFNLLTAHYRILTDRFSPDLAARLIAGEEVEIARVTGKSGASYRLTLGRRSIFLREGELGVCVRDGVTDQKLFSIAFTFGALEPGEPDALWIGALQGLSDQDAKARMVALTRDLYDLRPKDLMIHTVYALKRRIGLARLAAVSNRLQLIAQNGARRGRIADYDEYWTSLGGEIQANGFYRLPDVRARRNEADVKPAKRKAWRARYQIVDEIEAAILGL